MIGQTVAHYRILEKLGQGGMGEVYLAEDTKLDRKVALKFLPTAIESDPEARERLIREAKAACRLSHPNILTIYSVEEVDGRHFIVMEYIPGVTLGQFVQQRELSLADTLGLALPIAEGLAKAHQAGLVHRDIKPANVLVDEDGRPRILDFGLAKIEGAAKLTKTGSTVGTVSYSSPEATQGKEADARSDIFSFGVMLYEMIAGRLPFQGDHEAAVVYAIVHEPPEPLARYRAGVSAGLEHILAKCLSKLSEERYQSCEDLIADLKREKRLLESSGSTMSAGPVAQERKRSAWTLVAIGAVVVLLAAAIAYRWRAHPDEMATAPVSAPTLVVLPFTNQGDAEDEYFADGVTDEITTHLARINGLRVISRASAAHYRDSKLSLQEIAEQLGVNYILEGTVLWDKSGGAERVRISPELIHASDGFRTWGESYDRDLKQIFEVQAEIAGHIASELGLTLLGAQRAELARKPTESMVAYDYYLRARSELNKGIELQYFRNAEDLLRKAIAEDSGFTAAYATLAQAHIMQAWWFIGDDLDSARRIIDLTRKLDQSLPEMQLALGTYYTLGDPPSYERAAVALDIARSGLGESSDLYQIMGYLAKRQGNWPEAIRYARLALELDPRSANKCLDLADTYRMRREYDRAIELYDRAIAIGAPKGDVFHFKAMAVLWRDGNVDSARKVLEEASSYVDPVQAMVLEGRAAIQMLGHWRFGLLDGNLDSLQARYDRHFHSGHRVVYCVSKGQLYQQFGKPELARAFYDSALCSLDSLDKAGPDNFDRVSGLALIHSLLGHHQEAIRLARRSKALLPIDACHW